MSPNIESTEEVFAKQLCQMCKSVKQALGVSLTLVKEFHNFPWRNILYSFA